MMITILVAIAEELAHHDFVPDGNSLIAISWYQSEGGLVAEVRIQFGSACFKSQLLNRWRLTVY
ncbi:MAG: hypothetical protein EB010_10570 [Acidimicrobiia bacterium]|jgi:hypothetical protein|nr:hypothetical protein [Acidimicrobiia bacterium]